MENIVVGDSSPRAARFGMTECGSIKGRKGESKAFPLSPPLFLTESSFRAKRGIYYNTPGCQKHVETCHGASLHCWNRYLCDFLNDFFANFGNWRFEPHTFFPKHFAAKFFIPPPTQSIRPADLVKNVNPPTRDFSNDEKYPPSTANFLFSKIKSFNGIFTGQTLAQFAHKEHAVQRCDNWSKPFK